MQLFLKENIKIQSKTPSDDLLFLIQLLHKMNFENPKDFSTLLMVLVDQVS